MAEKKGAVVGLRVPSIRLGIIGLSQYPSLLRELEGTSLEVKAVADFDLRHESIQEAMAKGIQVSQDYTELIERPDLDLILNLIPDKTVEAIIHQLKPDNTKVVHAATPSFLQAFCKEATARRALSEILGDLCKMLSGFMDVGAFCFRLLQQIAEVCEAVAVGLWLREEQRLVFFKGLGLPQSIQACHPRLTDPGPFLRLSQERTPVWVKDIQAAEMFSYRECFEGTGLGSLLLVPILGDTEITGALGLFPAKQSLPDKEDVGFCSLLAGLLSGVLQRAGLLKGLREDLIRDELSGLYNDVYFMDRLRAEFKRATRNESSLSVLYLAIKPDGGVEHAEQMMIRPYIKAMAGELAGSIRNVDVPARYKLNDFAVILPDTGPSGALCTARRLLERLSTVRIKGIGERNVQLSIGAASYPEHASQPKELLDNAELSAFLASREGPNEIRLFPTGRMELDGLTQEAITKAYPVLSEVFELLKAQAKSDPFVLFHAREVARYTALIANELNLSPQHRTELGIAGWLHDLGKMALPDPNGGVQPRYSKLPELNLKIHPTIGAYILKNLINSPAIIRGVLYHHAHFDGTGHPARAQGEAIPLEGRILAVADSYHHMLSATAGSQQRPPHHVFQALREKAGRELDPNLVECLIRAITTP
ncbi:MAG: HD domain-containing phosphohydrolase [bacterium]